MVKKKAKDDMSTQEKIKQAARKLFTERGYEAVKTRDIATEAGINSALLNYYFHGKENLYREVMLENFQSFITDIIPIMSDEKLTVEEIMTKTAASYIDMLRSAPDLPYFALSSMKDGVPMTGNNPLFDKMNNVRQAFHKRIGESQAKNGAPDFNTAHIIMNFMGLVIFPFLARPIVMKVNKLTEEEFDKLMVERKALVPVWLKALSKAKYN